MSKVFCGIDFHKNESVLCAKTEKGELVQPITTVKSALLVKFLINKKDWVIGIEASGGTNEMATRLKESGHEVVILNPNQLRGITQSVKKTDHKPRNIGQDKGKFNQSHSRDFA